VQPLGERADDDQRQHPDRDPRDRQHRTDRPFPNRVNIHHIQGSAPVGAGGCPVIGTPDDVVAGLAELQRAGFDGFAFSFVNYLDEFRYFRDEVLPRLERAGLRTPRH